MSTKRLSLFLFPFIAACGDDATGSLAPDGATADAGAEVAPPADLGMDEGPVAPACIADSECAGFAEVLPCEKTACFEGQCVVIGLANGTPCKDGLLCTGPDFCVDGHCAGGPLDCGDQDPCTKDSCDGKVGCVHTPIDGACDDGDPCTNGDACIAGQCLGGEVLTDCCQADGQCGDASPCTDDACTDHVCVHAFNYAPCNDGLPCTLKDHCDGEGGCTGTPLLCEDGNPCTSDACDAASGACTSGPAPDGTPCEDGNPCTSPDACQGGACTGKGSLCQCTTDLDCAALEDGNLCNGTLLCLDFKCVVDPVSVVACNPTSDTACSKAACDPATGYCKKVAAPEGAACDDLNPCTSADGCLNGLCLGGPADCDDGNPCTFDPCSEVDGCTSVPNTHPCDDADACTENDQCLGGACLGAAVLCDDQNPCTDDACSGAGCTFAPNAAACDDGSACTSGDACAGGVCAGGANTCQCVTTADCAALEDGNLCNGTLQCTASKCQVTPGSIVTCSGAGDTACLKTTCEAATGQCKKAPAPNGAACSDGSACTTQDACKAGVCAGALASCDDGNACTDDACDPAKGCLNAPNTIVCSDGNPCTGNDHCQGGSCGGVQVGCDDGNACTVDACAAPGGCKSTPAANGTPCNDGSACTVSDACQAGACTGAPAPCDDANQCTADTCTNAAGCAHASLAGGTPCDDKSACTGGDNCQGGKCVGSPPSCDDGNPCTTDACNPASGCTHQSAPNGTTCTDGNACTAGDSCINGACQPGAPSCQCVTTADCKSLEDGNACNGTLTCVQNACKVNAATVVKCAAPGNPCAVAVCNAATGTCEPKAGPDGAACDDADACTTNDTCTAGACGGLAKSCDDGVPCTADSCAAGQCKHAAAFDGTPCADDVNSCTLDVCKAGSCTHVALADGLGCADDGNACTSDACAAGKCAHKAIADATPCPDDGNKCTYDQCKAGVCQHVSNDPPPIGQDQCFPVGTLTPNTGTVAGSWSDCGVADQFVYKCTGNKCSYTGAIDAWPCADPSFLYDGAATGYEYAYQMVAPADGTCTLIEYGEGVPQPGGGLFPVIDWFILSGAGACGTGACLEYVWENKTSDPVCGGKVCSYKSFPVAAGQKFYIVADLFDGPGTHQGYNYPKGWSIEVKCDSKQNLLLSEDFTDAVCNGCATTVDAPASCKSFGWHAVGGFADIVTGWYVGQLEKNTLLGYDCGKTSATVAFPAVALPAGSPECTLSFDVYADLDPADSGSCTKDLLAVQLAVGGGPATNVAGDTCAKNTGSSNPIGFTTKPSSKHMSYDITSYAGKTVTLSLAWSADAAANSGLGMIVDNVRIECAAP